MGKRKVGEMSKEFEVHIAGHEPRTIEAETAEEAARNYVQCFYPGPSDEDVEIVVKQGDKSQSLSATIEYGAEVYLADDWDDEQEDADGEPPHLYSQNPCE